MMRRRCLLLASLFLPQLVLSEGPRLEVQEQGLGPGGAQDLLWTADPGNPSYTAFDVIYGDLDLLRSSSGDFIAATAGCLLNDGSSPLVSLPLPTAGKKLFFLVRAQETVSVCGVGSWNESFAVAPFTQPADRDPWIASAATCPCP
jgi:hypothetical protein